MEPGFIARALFGLVAVALIGSVVGALVFLWVMAAHARVVGRPTPPPKA
jgi:hypothetical protein